MQSDFGSQPAGPGPARPQRNSASAAGAAPAAVQARPHELQHFDGARAMPPVPRQRRRLQWCLLR